MVIDNELVDDIMSLADVLPAQPGDGDYIDSDNGQCCCFEYDCKDAYIHWTSGF